jgi:hypothetical protein
MNRREMLFATLGIASTAAPAPKAIRIDGRGLVVLGLGHAGAKVQLALQAHTRGGSFAVLHHEGVRRQPKIGRAVRITHPIPSPWPHLKCCTVIALVEALRRSSVLHEEITPRRAIVIVDPAEAGGIRFLVSGILAPSFCGAPIDLWRVGALSANLMTAELYDFLSPWRGDFRERHVAKSDIVPALLASRP